MGGCEDFTVPLAGVVTSLLPARPTGPVFQVCSIGPLVFHMVCGTGLYSNESAPGSLLKRVDAEAKANMILTFIEAGWEQSAILLIIIMINVFYVIHYSFIHYQY